MFSGIDRLLFILENTGKKYNIEKIKKAYEYAKQLHEGQYRKSGEEYICHPVAVAEIVAGLELDTDSICAALLHDTIEDCSDKIDLEKIKKEFGDQVAELVDGLTKLVQIRIEDKEDAHMESLRKMFLAMAKDVRVIFIKLADRLHNMRTLNAQPENKRRTIALETMHVYAPLAHRLGMQRIKQELENLALSYLDPIGYDEVSNDIERKFGENRDFINKTRKLIHEKMNENGIKCTLEGRVKSVYSIYKKMYNQNKSFDEIYDFYAIRIIVNTELECYTALGIIHEMFNSMPGRFKDYISIPKPNMYRSLHTTVIGRDGIPFEVQIRTWEMHQIAEYGIAAHWKYKSGDKSDGDLDRKLEWIAKLIENESSTADPDEFIDALKIDIFQDETFVFTPNGDVVTLPQNANCIDFAYHIHSAVGNRMIGAKVNGMIVPIDRKLNNGEIVEIITSSASKGPSRDWLKIAHTSEARAKIRQWFKKEKRAENIEAGKSEIQAELRRMSPVHITDEQFTEITGKVAARMGMNSPEDLFGMLGYGGISMTTVGSRLKEEFERVVMPEPEVKITDVTQVQTVQRPRSSHSYGGVIVDGVEGCQVKFAKCCNPLPGDSIVGFITKGYGISIHKVDCPNILNSMSKETDRFVNVEWKEVDEGDAKRAQYEALMQVVTEDRISMLADISTALADMKVSIIQINTQKRTGGEVVFNIAVACKNLAHFNSIMARLKSIKNVIAVERGYTKNGG
ncbi:MAG: bifunctional (p)ppGpp synthetase/guanosine-3',5'-bis(diphosphate) 3'-pyrophosphohydrolase [Clostridiales bacterium]|nr:bifunctional (p)ppGpp synthetase/guanosine-3',5'-bis(diphosphate) 3'-pyrophosphohydrolase [Clostridiales bacterium]